MNRRGVRPGPRIYLPANRCIYCGELDISRLTDEHIIPLSLGGTIRFPNASCIDCAKTTRGITETISRSMYGRVRARLNYPTRRPRERPSHFSLRVQSWSGRQRDVQVPARYWPRAYPVLQVNEAAVLTGVRQPTYQVAIRSHREDIDELYRRGLVRQGETIIFRSTMSAKDSATILSHI